MHSRLRKRHVAGHLSLLDELSEAQAGCAHQTPKSGSRISPGAALWIQEVKFASWISNDFETYRSPNGNRFKMLIARS